MGVKISGSAIAADSIDGTHIELSNNEWLEAVDFAGTGNVNIIKVNASDLIEFGATLSSPVLLTPQIQDTSSDHQYIFAVSELAADRTITLPLLGADDTFVFEAFTQTLTNKTLTSPTIDTAVINSPTTLDVSDAVFSIQDNVDATKEIRFEASGITTGTIRTATMPDADITLTGTALAQTLTNKTIDADNNTISNIADAEIKAAAAIAVNKLAALTASRLLVSDGSGFLSASAVTSTEAGYLSGVTSAIQTQIDGKEGTLTNSAGLAAALSDETGTGVVVFNSSPNILTPDIDGADINFGTASNTNRIVLPSDSTTNLDALTDTAGLFAYDTTLSTPVYNNGSGWQQISGAGGGVTNYITNNDAETDTTGWATYADAAATSPVDGTGGAATTTFTRNTSSPLIDSADFLITKDAANRQGEGASYDFSVETADKTNRLGIKFNYSTSANYADGDIRVYLYDVTNATVIEPAPTELKAKSNGIFLSSFQVASDSTSYRLIFHVASTNATAYTVQIDNVTVSPDLALAAGNGVEAVKYSSSSGQSISDNTLTIVDFATAVHATSAAVTTGAAWKYTADESGYYYVDARVVYSSTAWTADESARMDLYKNGSRVNYLDYKEIHATGATALFMDTHGSTTVYLEKGDYIDIRVIQITGGALTLLADGEQNYVNIFRVSEQSDSLSGKEIAMRAGLLADDTGVNGTKVVVFDNVDFDTTNSLNTSTGVFTAPESGTYQVSAYARLQNLDSSGNYSVSIKKNGTALNAVIVTEFYTTTTIKTATVSDLLSLNKGDTVSFETTGDAAYDIDTTTYMAIHKIVGDMDALIGNGSGIVASKYKSTAGQSISSGAYTIVDFATNVHDTTSNVTTGASWKYTANHSGYYRVHAKITFSNTSFTTGQIAALVLYKNGSLEDYLDYREANATNTTFYSPAGSTTLYLTKGDYIDIRAYQDTGGAVTLTTTSGQNRVEIEKL